MRKLPNLLVSLMLAAVLVSLVVVACSGGDEPTTAPTPAPLGERPPPPPAPAEARAVWDEPSFELRGDATGPFTAGTEGRFTIRLTPRGNYHVNHDYPLSITLTGPAPVTFPSTTLAADRATTFTEQLAQFDVPFTATAGTHRVTALVDFAVCTPEVCMPDTRTVAVDLAVQ